ncbi:hypothetical protein [Nonomuraea endophytica]|uniref:hypothetical protein n=1 Tax=Nonomuraea endophytica TaxID=714136 RepID=UPI0037C9D7DC
MRTVYRLVVTAGAILFCLLAGVGVANALPWEASSVPAPCSPPHCENLPAATQERCAPPFCPKADPAPAVCTPPWCPVAPQAPGTIREEAKRLACYPPRCADG